jgi:outer membrane protein
MTGNFVRSITTVTLASLLVFAPLTPALAQNQAPPQSPNPAPSQQQAPAATQAQPTQPATQAQPTQIVTQVPPVPFHIAIGPDYSQPKPYFPHVLLPYEGRQIDVPVYTNSPRIDQLIQDGQLRITEEDAVELALENNLDIAVQRYNAWMWETDLLRAKGGGILRGLAATGTTLPFVTVPLIAFDPSLVTTLSMDDKIIPVNNPLTAGTGGAGSASTAVGVQGLATHTSIGNFQYNQGFQTGTTISMGFDTTRASSSSAANLFNPYVQTLGTIAFTQQLLNGFSLVDNQRYIRVAKIGMLANSYAFQQSVLTDVFTVENAYWELVFARDNIAVQQRSVDLAQRLYEDNQRQVQIGTLAPIEVVRAEAQLASAQQALIDAQNAQLQQQTLLLSLITKDTLAPSVRDVEIVPLDIVQAIPPIEDIPLIDAVAEAMGKRPDVLQAKTNLSSDDINVKTTRNNLLPTLALSGYANSAGLSGNSKVVSNGVTSIVPSGWAAAESQLFTGEFPEWEAQVQLTVPIRNRVAQADNARAILLQRQDQENFQHTYSNVAVDVHNAQISLRESRAALSAAQKTLELQELTLSAEQIKFQLGASTILNVVLTQQELATAASAEVRAAVNLAEARVNFDRAMGRTLEVHKITISDAKTGAPTRDTLIPGTNVAGQIIGQKQSY